MEDILTDELRLTDAPARKKLRIIRIDAGINAKRRLNSMGFHAGDVLLRLTNGKWGPVLVQNISNNSSKIALGKGLAGKVIIEVAENG